MSDTPIRAIEHVAIAVRNVPDTLDRYANLGFERVRVEDLPGGIRSHVLRSGTAYIEILAATSEDSDLTGFLERRGEGLHHLCLQVDTIDEAFDAVELAGCSLISESPISDARGRRVFVHPGSNAGVMLGLVEVDPG